MMRRFKGRGTGVFVGRRARSRGYKGRSDKQFLGVWGSVPKDDVARRDRRATAKDAGDEHRTP